jgi:ribonucleoside-triphosphate reductase (formate)
MPDRMPDKVFKKVKKRNGRLHKFNPQKIERAIASAGSITGEYDEKAAAKLAARVVRLAIDKMSPEATPTVEQIQDFVEEILLSSEYHKTAKEYILYRDQRERVRDMSSSFNRDLINKYLKQLDWQVKENSNMGFSLQGLNNYMSSELSKVYWLNEIYPKEIRDSHIKGDFHIHDLSAISVYCVGWDLWDLLVEGFTGVPEKTESKPAKHFRTALGQIVNFFYTLQGEAAGAQAFSSLDTLLAPFIRYDKLSYKDVKQTMQEFIFNINVPTRVGFQCMSEDTEILTPSGWKRHNEVSTGDTISTFNMDKQCIEDLPVNNVFSREYNGKMFNLKNRITDQLISPKHRVVRRKFNSNEYVSERIETVSDLKSPVIVPVGSKGKAVGNCWLCDEHVELAAWIISDGTYDKGKRGVGRISIYQSKLANPEKYNRIKELCHNLNLEYTERTQFGLGRPCQVIRFNAEATECILEILEGNPKSIPGSILNSDSETAKLFLETYIQGDGHEECKITTTSELLRDQLQHLAVIVGYGSTVSVRLPDNKISKKTRYIIRLIRHVDTYISDIREVDYEGVIWCPNTKNETVIARRNGKVFITGNTPFTNVTLDLVPGAAYRDQNVIIGGQPQEEKYADFQKEMDWFNKAFFEVMLEGDARGRVFTFPIPTYNITKDFDWDNPNLTLLWEITARYGIPYFSNFINSEMKPEDARSMCCRLRLNTKELASRGGGLFGANPLTGSIGVVTLNMPKIAHSSSNGWDFMRNLGKVMDLAKESLEIKRKVLEEFTEKDLYPYTKFYLRSVRKRFHKYWTNHFSTIGLVGVNEACINLLGEDITTKRGSKFAHKVLDYMRKRLLKYQKETGNNYNLEATPAEGTSYRLAIKDKKLDPGIKCANEEAYTQGAEPFYTNSTQFPVNYTDDLFKVLDDQDGLQTKYTGGTVIHLFIGEKIEDPEAVKKLVRVICENYHLPYFTITPTFSICPRHGYLAGEHKYCPKCDEEIILELESKKEDK